MTSQSFNITWKPELYDHNNMRQDKYFSNDGRISSAVKIMKRESEQIMQETNQQCSQEQQQTRFPDVVHAMVTEANTSIISWVTSGDAFVVRDMSW